MHHWVPKGTYCIRSPYKLRDPPNTQKQAQRGNQIGKKEKKKKNMPQMKEIEKFPEKEVNEIEVSNLPDIEFKKWL